MGQRNRGQLPRRMALARTLLGLLDLVLLVLAAAVISATFGAVRDPNAAPESAVIGLLCACGLLGLLLAALEVTRAALMDRSGMPRGRHPAEWATRLAAILIGAGGVSAQATPAPAVGVITAPAVPGAGSGSSAPIPVLAPDPRWSASEPASGTGTHADIALLAPTRPADLDEVVVRRGECLWDIVARSLGPGASQQQIAAEWPRWYAANRLRIGADPDLIHPGLRLVVPKERA